MVFVNPAHLLNNVQDQESESADPTIQKLFNSSTSSSVGSLKAYPLDIINDNTPGHFIMIQAYEVEGIQINKFKDITQSSLRVDEIDSEIRILRDLAADQRRVASLEAERAQLSKNLFNQIQNSPYTSGSGIKNDVIFQRDNSLKGRFGTTERTDIIGRKKTLKDTIVLYMPENLQAVYSFDYSLENNSIGVGVRAALDSFASIASGNRIQGGLDAMKVIRNVAIENPEASSALVGGALGGFGGALIGAVGANLLGGPVSSLTRRVVNPHMEFLFKSVNQRSFQYTFNMTPRSKKEAEEVHEIIKTLKKHAHPEIDDIHAFLKMPAEFDIIFYSNMKENQYVNRVLPCALTEISVNYAPDGVTSFFKSDGDDKGQPSTRIELSLSFSEITTMDRRHIEAGY